MHPMLEPLMHPMPLPGQIPGLLLPRQIPRPLPPRSPGSDTGIDTDLKTARDSDFNFWLGTRPVAACGKVCDHHPNVVFLRVLPTTLSRLSGCLSRLLPATWKERLEVRWPEWFLPDHIILKREKPDWVEEFDDEVAMYKLLAPLGGLVVPKLYGQTEYPGTDDVRRRALVMSDIGGVSLDEPKVGSLPLDHVEEMLKKAFRSILDAGVIHCDTKLDNIHLVDDRIMLIDFDSSEPIGDVDPEYATCIAVNRVLRQYIMCHDLFPDGIPWGVLPSDRPDWPKPVQQAQETVDLSRPRPFGLGRSGPSGLFFLKISFNAATII
ncbi:hypothetical protein RB600_007059 [Gaeumannomyces tritici]